MILDVLNLLVTFLQILDIAGERVHNLVGSSEFRVSQVWTVTRRHDLVRLDLPRPS